jgi:hypothetical protein
VNQTLTRHGIEWIATAQPFPCCYAARPASQWLRHHRGAVPFRRPHRAHLTEGLASILGASIDTWPTRSRPLLSRQQQNLHERRLVGTLEHRDRVVVRMCVGRYETHANVVIARSIRREERYRWHSCRPAAPGSAAGDIAACPQPAPPHVQRQRQQNAPDRLPAAIPFRSGGSRNDWSRLNGTKLSIRRFCTTVVLRVRQESNALPVSLLGRIL